jgi:hypothetical protein
VLSFSPAVGQIRQERIEDRWATTTAVQQVLGGSSASESTDGSPIQPLSTTDGTDAQTLSQQFENLGVALLGAPSQSTWRPAEWAARWCRCLLLCFQCSTKQGQDANGEVFERIGQVVREMPTIGHLERTWRTTSGGTGIDAIAVTADDFDTGMVIEPMDQHIGRWVLEQVDDTMRIRVH